MLINKYEINLVRAMREQTRVSEIRRTRILGFSVLSFGLLILSLLYSGLQILIMQATLRTESNQVTRIQNEYLKYKQTRMVVSKSDLELLDSLQNSRIYWTNKLAALALHLPDNYWISSITYRPPEFSATGSGYGSAQQEQLVTIERYLNELRADSSYADVFKQTHFVSTSRIDESHQSLVSFEFSSTRQRN